MSENLYREAYTEAALEDILAIEGYLELQSPGLGDSFRGELNSFIDLLLEFPELAPVISPKGVRRRLLKRFPYAILYVLTQDLMLVLAVAHTSRPPGHWSERL